MFCLCKYKTVKIWYGIANICKQVCILDTMYGIAIIGKTDVECSDFKFDSIQTILPS